MINQQDWLRARKNLLQQVKSQVQVRLGPLPRDLRQYAKRLEKEFDGSWTPCSEQEIKRGLAKARVILSADFHAYAQSQRAHIRLLRDYLGQRPVILMLECLPSSANSLITRFLAGGLSERKFLESVGWDKVWGFPWEHYRPLIEFARQRGFCVQGLNHPHRNGLKARDRWMTNAVAGQAALHPESLIYVVVGETHLASSHLPKLLLSEGLGAGDVITIFQDVEKLYFRLAKRKREGQVDFLKSRDHRYCFMVSPPWMKWQSYLMYLEHTCDQELQDGLSVDFTDHVAALVEVLEGDLKLKSPRSRLQVFGPNSKALMTRLKSSLPKRFGRALVYHLEHDMSFFVPEKDLLYLSRPTINHASSLAGQFLHAHMSGRRRTLWRMPEDFLPLIWMEAVGFFFSKWMNPKRKADNLESLKLQMGVSQPKDRGRQAFLLALDQRFSEVLYIQTGRIRGRKYRPRATAAYWEAAKMMGSMMGERLYQMVRSKAVTHTELLRYLKVDLENNKFEDFYWKMILSLEADEKAK